MRMRVPPHLYIYQTPGRLSIWERSLRTVWGSGPPLNFPGESSILSAGEQAGRSLCPLRAERKVRTPQSSVLANGQDLSGLFRFGGRGWAGTESATENIPPRFVGPPPLGSGQQDGVRVKWCGSFGSLM